MIAKSLLKANENVSFSLRQSLKPLLKQFSEEVEKAGLVFHFDIPLTIPDSLVGTPQELKNNLTKTFQSFLKKTLKTNPGKKSDQLIEGGIQVEADSSENSENLLLTFVFETARSKKDSKWITAHFQFSVSVDTTLPVTEGFVAQPINLSHLKALFFTTPELYPTLTTLFDSWKMPVTLLTALPKTLPEHDLIILTDQVGPLSGFDLAASLKLKAPRSPFIFISSHPKRGDAALCRDLGIQSYLSHPIQPIELWETIKRVLQMPSSANKISELITKHSLREEDSKLNILLIPSGDMNHLDLADMGSLLLSQGHRVTMITSPDELKKLPILVKSFDLIVTDSERRDQLQIQKIQTPIVTFDPDTFDGNQRIILEKIEHLI